MRTPSVQCGVPPGAGHGGSVIGPAGRNFSLTGEPRPPHPQLPRRQPDHPGGGPGPAAAGPACAGEPHPSRTTPDPPVFPGLRPGQRPTKGSVDSNIRCTVARRYPCYFGLSGTEQGDRGGRQVRCGGLPGPHDNHRYVVDHAPPDLSASAHPDADPGGGDQQEAVADGGRPVTLPWALLLRRDGAVQWACLVTRRVLMERVPQARSACTPG